MLLDFPIEQHRLVNGLRVNLSRDSTVPVVGVNLWYGVGSRNERVGKTGFAHLFEHMMFQGSEHVAKNAHFELIERAGGTLNASTWFDRTNYFDTVPSHFLELALWLESDRMGWMLPAMTQEKLDNQRDVVMNEKRQRYDNQPYGDWDEWIQTMVFPSAHPYAHTVIGSMEDIEAATLEDVSAFFRTFYLPNNCVLTLCGDFDSERALESIERFFGGIARGEDPPELPGEVGIAPTLEEPVRREIEAEVPLPRVIMAMRVPTMGSEGFHAAEMAGSVLGTGRSSRLYRGLVRDRRVAKDVMCFVFPLTTGASMMLVWATGVPGVEPEQLEAALAEELAGMAAVSEEDVARAVAVNTARFVQGLQAVGQRADVISAFDLLLDDPHRINTEMDRLARVTPGQVREFAGSFLTEQNRATLVYVPKEAT